jgi:LPXTG-site transpeptidase (sortase) family protein
MKSVGRFNSLKIVGITAVLVTLYLYPLYTSEQASPTHVFAAQAVHTPVQKPVLEPAQTLAKTSARAIEPKVASGVALPTVKAPKLNSVPGLATKVAEAEVTMPLKLLIPSISINASIVAMGLTKDGKMDVPNNFTEIGWYKLGAKPGEKGSAVMGAHVDNGGNISGVFKNLKNVKVGDEIKVLNSDGNYLVYKVTDRKIYDYRTTDTQEIFAKNDTSRLNLITCYGTFLPKENTYNQRLVVFAELVS